jgi:hypothetical protein
MGPRIVYLVALLVAGPSRAEPLVGVVDDPELRSRVDVVYVERVLGFTLEPRTHVLYHRGDVMRPRVLPLVVGEEVAFKSEDPEPHLVRGLGPGGRHFERALMPSLEFSRRFDAEGVWHLTCAQHPDMEAFLLVLQNPFYGTIDRQTGRFVLRGVPAGTWVVRVWGRTLSDEQLGWRQVVRVGEEPAARNIASR